MSINKKQLLLGMATYLPGVNRLYAKKTGGTVSARYCYSVWMRHLVLALRHGLPAIPKSVAELGPGESLGMGMAALISGAEKYYAFDIIRLINSRKNLKIFDELVTLFNNKERIPDDREFPRVKPFLDSYDFPEEIFTDEILQHLLDVKRLEFLRKSILHVDSAHSAIQYIVPWHSNELIQSDSVDMIFSQAVLEHVDDLEETYRAMFSWLKPGGVVTHQIDFKCHGLADDWNGHWEFSDLTWKLLRGRRPYLINRKPYSSHRLQLERTGFKLSYNQLAKSGSTVGVKNLSSDFQLLTEDDVVTSGAYIVAIK